MSVLNEAILKVLVVKSGMTALLIMPLVSLNDPEGRNLIPEIPKVFPCQS